MRAQRKNMRNDMRALASASLHLADTTMADLLELRRQSEQVADAAVAGLEGRTLELRSSVLPYVHELASVASVRPLTDR